MKIEAKRYTDGKANEVFSHSTLDGGRLGRLEHHRHENGDHVLMMMDNASNHIVGTVAFDPNTWAQIERDIIEAHIARVQRQNERLGGPFPNLPGPANQPDPADRRNYSDRMVPRSFPRDMPELPQRISIGVEAGAMQFTGLQLGREHTTVSTYAPRGVTLLHPPGHHVTIEFNGDGETLARLKLPTETWEHLKKVGRDQDAMPELPQPDGPIRIQVRMPGGMAQSLALPNPDRIETIFPVGGGVLLRFIENDVEVGVLKLTRNAYAMIRLAACRWIADEVRNSVELVMNTIEHDTKLPSAPTEEPPLSIDD